MAGAVGWPGVAHMPWDTWPPTILGPLAGALAGGIFLLAVWLLGYLTKQPVEQTEFDAKRRGELERDRTYEHDRYVDLTARFDSLAREHEQCVIGQAQLNGELMALKGRLQVVMLQMEQQKKAIAEGHTERAKLQHQVRGLEAVMDELRQESV